MKLGSNRRVVIAQYDEEGSCDTAINVQIQHRVNDGWYYLGEGTYCSTLKEAMKYISKLDLK